MLTKKISLIILFLITTSDSFSININNIKKVVIWGHKLHSHTHSYIHMGFERAFKHLGFQTYWFDNNDNVSNFDFSGSLFLTESQVDQNIPIRTDCFYILHNCDGKKYKSIFDANRAIMIQVYTHDCDTRDLEQYSECKYILFDRKGKLVYMPWATDLLPHEIEENKKYVLSHKNQVINWIGTIGGGYFGNIEKIGPFQQACLENNVIFKRAHNVSTKDNIRLIQESYMAPTIVGTWQEEKGYIPCRIFKNISYGQMGITNSHTCYDLFDKKIVYNSDTYQLFYDGLNRLKNIKPEEIYELMDIVKNKHTYIARINLLLKFFAEVN